MKDAPYPTWFLEGFTDESRRVWRTPLASLPFRIGRSPANQLFLDSPSVSQRHAEIERGQGGLMICDLGSTNGTFVNDQPLAEGRVLTDGDVVRFADWEFRVVERANPFAPATATLELKMFARAPEGELEVERRFREMVVNRTYWPVFQPIVRLDDSSIIGYEALGRATLGDVDIPPGELFGIAEGLGRAAELSDLFRREQLREAAAFAADSELFLNTHPAELTRSRTLAESLERWNDRRGALPRLCIEINETAAIDLTLLSGLRSQLEALEVGLAFDDFGTGQPRLFELAEISPRYVKFDRAWIHGLDNASERRLDLVKSLVRMVQEFKITPIAEGVERSEEAVACAELGFDLAQGYFLGRPDRASTF